MLFVELLELFHLLTYGLYLFSLFLYEVYLGLLIYIIFYIISL